ncbi:winged helix-turn-helix domain-containing protein [Streptomyces tsukubensis]|nr:winged helix-turn-helix domain-containing protein [Streptomyces tsukubensis]QFR93859.1 helix-turn-helix domain-containing protein [Streptomyces tsukubensis]
MTEPPEPLNIHTLDPRSLRGLAHPLRVRLWMSLRHTGPATATQLGALLGESSGSTSYHLRQLAAHGFIEDDPEHGEGRERWWRSVHDGTRLEEPLFRHEDPSVRGAADVVLGEFVALHARELSTWVTTRRTWSEEWSESTNVSQQTLRLTPALSAELGTRIHEVIEEFRSRTVEPHTPDSAQVRIHTHVFPTRSETSPAPPSETPPEYLPELPFQD